LIHYYTPINEFGNTLENIIYDEKNYNKLINL
jgi:hypothetical protein